MKSICFLKCQEKICSTAILAPLSLNEAGKGLPPSKPSIPSVIPQRERTTWTI